MGNEPIDIKSIFSEALQKKDAQEQAAYLDKACGNDMRLRAKVEALLRAHQEAGDFLKAPAFGADVTLENALKIEGPGTRIGRYELLELIGEGGMGLVYLAEQKEPVKRRVALKIIKPGMDSKQVIARFEAERQALALSDHPNIAHIFDAGTTETGRPYFVMEYVKGMSITRYCDERKLNIEQRLRLFEQVCEAVHHAHQKGIIHRDIKPSNVLVSVHGDRAVPKIIDFGIAKAITQPLTEKTFFTYQGQLLGTPEYMSPEQVDLATQDIDTRSDIYSLGVVLYELLAGVLPFERESFEHVGFAEIQQMVREQEPDSPSIRLTHLGEKAKTIAASRGTQVIALARRLHRELEWIPLKAMRKDRCRRYRSASELADDVRNYLNGLPLIAGPETAVYRVRKFVYKHAGSVATVALVAVAILLGLVVSTAMYFRAEDARKNEAVARAQAEDAREKESIARSEAEAARDEAKQYAKTLETIVPFYEFDTFLITKSFGRMGWNMTFDDALASCGPEFERNFIGPALTRANGYSFFGHAFEGFGRYQEASDYLKKTLDIRRAELGDEDPLTIVSANNLALVYAKMGRLAEADPVLVKSVEISRTVLGERHNVTGDSVKCMAIFLEALAAEAMNRYQAGEYEIAVSTLSRADDLRKSPLQKPSGIRELAYLTMALHRCGRNQEAQDTLDRLRRLSEESDSILEQHQRCLWEAEKTLVGNESTLAEIWGHIQIGQLQQAAEQLAQLKTGANASDPRMAGHLDRLVKALARAHYIAGERNYHRGGSLQETLQNYQAAVQINPAFAIALNELAHLQGTSPVPEFRDSAKAVENATSACDLAEWKNPLYLDTLAAAYGEAGDFDAAVNWQKKAMSLFAENDRSGNRDKMNGRLKMYQAHQPYRAPEVRPMVAWWKFDETEGQTAVDSSGNNLHGRLVGNPQWQAGVVAGALAFDGKDDYVNCGYDPLLDITDAITVAAWIKVSSFTLFCQCIVARGESSWRLQRWWDSNRLEFACQGITMETREVPGVCGNINVNNGEWHHVVGTYDGDRIALYVDGKLDNSELASGEIALSNQPIYIGHEPDSPKWSPDKYWNGMIDDVRIYNYALSPAEVAEMYAAGTPVTRGK